MVDIAIHLGGRMSIEQYGEMDQSEIFNRKIRFERVGRQGFKTYLGDISAEDAQALDPEEFVIAEPANKRPGRKIDWKTGQIVPSKG